MEVTRNKIVTNIHILFGTAEGKNQKTSNCPERRLSWQLLGWCERGGWQECLPGPHQLVNLFPNLAKIGTHAFAIFPADDVE